MEPVKPLPNPNEMERVIRKAGYLYCGAGLWRHPVDKNAHQVPFPPHDRVELVEAFRRVIS